MNFYSYLRKKGKPISMNGNTILFRIDGHIKKDANLTLKQQKSFIRATQQFLDHDDGREGIYDDFEIEKYSQPKNTNEDFYRYITKYELETFVKNGKFRLGTINHYQRIKDKKRVDVGEGFTHLNLESPNKQHIKAYISGLNNLILCGSYIPPTDKRAEYLLKNFGPCVLKVTNINSFIRIIERHIRSTSTLYQRVRYSNIKAVKYFCENDFGIENDEVIDFETFSLIQNIISPFTIFSKTSDFSNEYELRFAFATKKDQRIPINLDIKGLLDHIEIIKE